MTEAFRYQLSSGFTLKFWLVSPPNVVINEYDCSIAGLSNSSHVINHQLGSHLETTLSLINEYGTFIYLLLFGYCALKSGSLPLFGGYAAQAGALELGYVGLATFAGGYLGDELRFFTARKYGVSIFEKRPRLNAIVIKAEALMKRYGTAYMFLYRYPKGMRTIGAFPVGLSNIDWQRFTLLNAASAMLWMCLLVGIGYLFGSAIESAVSDGWGFLSIALLLMFIAVGFCAWRRVNQVPAN